MVKIPSNEVAAALERKGVSSKCPMCGKSELKGLREEEFQLISMNHPNNGSIDGTAVTMLPCATVTCLHCGYVARFVLADLLK